MKPRWNYNPPDFDYEPAPIEHSASEARRELAKLYNQELNEADEGPCDDCTHHGYRVRYGRLKLCDNCSRHRWRVANAA